MFACPSYPHLYSGMVTNMDVGKERPQNIGWHKFIRKSLAASRLKELTGEVSCRQSVAKKWCSLKLKGDVPSLKKIENFKAREDMSLEGAGVT